MGADTHTTEDGGGFFDFTAKEGFVVGAVTAVVQFGTALVYGIRPGESDFAIFQRTTARFLEGHRMYAADMFDFTPPVFHVLLLPLAHVDARIGFVLWTLANAVVAWLVLMLVLRAVPSASGKQWTIAAWAVNAAGVQMTVRLGQVSWLAALTVTCAWIATRSSRWLSAGAWSGLAIVLKPFLLVLVPVFIVRCQWIELAVCTGTAVALSALGVLIFGWVPFTDWIGNLRATPSPDYAIHFLNASWLAVVARAGAPYALGTMLSGATVLAMLWRARTSDADEMWLLAVLAALLASPVGWVYYQPLLLGPGVALAMSGRLTHLRWIAPAWVFPALGRFQFQHGSMLVALSLGSIYFWGMFVVFVQMALRPVFVTAGSFRPHSSGLGAWLAADRPQEAANASADWRR